MRPLFIRIVLASLLLSPISVFSKNTEKIVIENAWVRMLPPSVKTTGMFFSLRNKGEKQRKLIKAESSISERVEIHTHIKDGEMFKMRQVEEIVISANSTHNFKPGGDHIMFINLKRPLVKGEELEVKLTFEDGSLKVIHPTVK